MVEEPQDVTRRPRRTSPSKKRLVLRRAAVIVLLASGVALLVWLTTVAIGAIGGSGKKAAPVVQPRPLRIVFPEGFTRKQMAERIAAVDAIARHKRHVDPRLSSRSYLAVTRSSALPGKFAGDGKRRSLEGFLFPATYDFAPKTTSRRLARDQIEAFRRAWKKVDLRYARSRNLTPYDVLIIASMIEREVIAPRERRLVAAVIYNRLRNGIPLAIDATTRYGLDIPPAKPITESDLQSSNPYNTRNRLGLPPTPIANPGLPSMQAAAHPARVDYLYFVRKPDKIHHFFTSSLDAFNAYLSAHPVVG